MNKSKRLKKIPDRYRARVEDRLKEVSRKIQSVRESKGITQEELAEELNISPMTVQFIEQGRRYPSIQLLFYICEYLRINIKLT